ncbi:uncharacterized protein LOC111829312 [Capsella rubella]|uniref:uncharacterized protein LOC111829312 n=1 Tax=Capsella rubella TaxID=81985 RepID=UPI000CD4D237|nr:uncharacterized protein LOC111829312 [Capsella rubella]
MNQKLTAPVSEEEVYQALSHMSVDKAPGPDGLNAGFYKYHWNAIKSEFQTAFIPGRLITDNIIVTHELLHSLRTKNLKTPYMAIKLDIAKAFDKVEWNYIEAVMKRLGFAEKWCSWIMKCITTVSYSVLVNGSPSKKIIPQRGIRQGDPLSPYLYLLCTEGLSSLLSAAVKSNNIHGFKASRSGPKISHMLFADDSLLFCKANEEECKRILEILKLYASASGQHINFQKSAILFGKKVDTNLQDCIKHHTCILKTGGFGRYLGLPEAMGRSKKDTFSYICQKLQNKLESWYSKFLSPGGKEVMIKAVATALPTYTMSCFLLPKRITSELTGHIRKFWWSSIKDKHKIPWVAWSKITKLKQYGGLGFRDLHHFNIALLAKQPWRMLKQPQSLLTRVLHAKYFSNTGLMDATLGHRPSHAWRSILQGLQLIKQGLKWRIGDGETVRIWRDPWLDNPPRPARSVNHQEEHYLTVSSLLTPNSSNWCPHKLQQTVHPDDISHIMKVRPRLIKSPDVPVWIFTKDGHYTFIWSLHVPPKIKHFWWKVLHNALPVTGNLALRNIKIQKECNFCGEAEESIMHILFHCRDLLNVKESESPTDCLFPFIGWRIWKARNDLLFRNKRWAIPTIIHQAIMDYKLWKEASSLNQSYNGKPQEHKDSNNPQSLHRTMDQSNSYFCYTDGSWINSTDKAGIGWSLHNYQGKCLIKGSSSIDPTMTALEAETIALREAILQVKRLNYYPVIFCGDSKILYRCLDQLTNGEHAAKEVAEIQRYIEDILALAKGSYKFKFIRREVNVIADMLAREGRTNQTPMIVSCFFDVYLLM